MKIGEFEAKLKEANKLKDDGVAMLVNAMDKQLRGQKITL